MDFTDFDTLEHEHARAVKAIAPPLDLREVCIAARSIMRDRKVKAADAVIDLCAPEGLFPEITTAQRAEVLRRLGVK